MRERRPKLADQHGCSLPDVRFWHKADTTIALNHVRFWHKADIPHRVSNVCFRG
jgi:hypothetical protein